MKISNHRLYLNETTPAPFLQSPNSGGPFIAAGAPRYLVMHYTAGADFNSSVRWLTNPLARASAHLVIGRNGEITQLVPFNQIAWHAGPSFWEGINGLNGHSIGIELDNAGQLRYQNGRWITWFNKVIPDDEVLIGQHRDQNFESGWQLFPIAQLEAAITVSALLVQTYGLSDVLGHDDISPNRKVDPGVAFPMNSFKSKVLGRMEDNLPVFETTTTLNIRKGPNHTFDTLPESPLPKGTKVSILQNDGQWRLVNILAGQGHIAGISGWVNGRFLSEAMEI